MSTDVIVGFPGETEADFQMTLDLVKDIGFTGLFGFKYSPRPFTPALKLADDVSEAEKSDRLARLFEVSEAQGRAHLERLVGTTASVLVEGQGKTGAFEGRTDRNEIVHVSSDARDLTGEIVDVEITSAFKHSLAGTPTTASLAALGPATSSMSRPPRRRRALPLVVE
jgi:tRNA-2-methylthio-N6-dimethylallyladenosine synthase